MIITGQVTSSAEGSAAGRSNGANGHGNNQHQKDSNVHLHNTICRVFPLGSQANTIRRELALLLLEDPDHRLRLGHVEDILRVRLPGAFNNSHGNNSSHHASHMHPQLQTALSDPTAEQVFLVNSTGHGDWRKNLMRLNAAVLTQGTVTPAVVARAAAPAHSVRSSRVTTDYVPSKESSRSCDMTYPARLDATGANDLGGSDSSPKEAAATLRISASGSLATGSVGKPVAAIMAALLGAWPKTRSDDDEYLALAAAFALVLKSDSSKALPHYSLTLSDLAGWLQQMAVADPHLANKCSQLGIITSGNNGTGVSAAKRPTTNRQMSLADLLAKPQFRSHLKLHGDKGKRIVTLALDKLTLSSSPAALLAAEELPLPRWEASLGVDACPEVGSDAGGALPQFLFDFEGGGDLGQADMGVGVGLSRDQFGAGVAPVAGSSPRLSPPPPPQPPPPYGPGGDVGSPHGLLASRMHRLGGNGSGGGLGIGGGLLGTSFDRGLDGPALLGPLFGSPAWSSMGIARTLSGVSSSSNSTFNTASNNNLLASADAPVRLSSSLGALSGSIGPSSSATNKAMPWPSTPSNPPSGLPGVSSHLLSSSPLGRLAGSNHFGSSPPSTLPFGGLADLFGRSPPDKLFGSPVMDSHLLVAGPQGLVPKEVASCWGDGAAPFGGPATLGMGVGAPPSDHASWHSSSPEFSSIKSCDTSFADLLPATGHGSVYSGMPPRSGSSGGHVPGAGMLGPIASAGALLPSSRPNGQLPPTPHSARHRDSSSEASQPPSSSTASEGFDEPEGPPATTDLESALEAILACESPSPPGNILGSGLTTGQLDQQDTAGNGSKVPQPSKPAAKSWPSIDSAGSSSPDLAALPDLGYPVHSSQPTAASGNSVTSSGGVRVMSGWAAVAAKGAVKQQPAGHGTAGAANGTQPATARLLGSSSSSNGAPAGKPPSGLGLAGMRAGASSSGAAVVTPAIAAGPRSEPGRLLKLPGRLRDEIVHLVTTVPGLKMEDFDDGVLYQLTAKKSEEEACAALRTLADNDVTNIQHLAAYINHVIKNYHAPGDGSTATVSTPSATVRANSVAVSCKAILQKLPLRVYKRLEDVVNKCSYMEWKHFDAGVIKVMGQLSEICDGDVFEELDLLESTDLSNVEYMPAYLNKRLNNRLWSRRKAQQQAAQM